MTALDLREHPPRGPRETLLGFYFLPRTVDKLRTELPGGNPGNYVNEERGFSAYVVRRLGLDMDEFRQAVARIDPSAAPALNAKFETFVVDRMSPDDQKLVRRRHPVMAVRPELSKILDILEADDHYVP
jgi:Domain of unknown function (DUF5069)